MSCSIYAFNAPSGYRLEPCSAAAMHPVHLQAGLFAIHIEVFSVTVVQAPWSCNMTTSMVADDPNSYMAKMCSPGYYGPLCTLCLLHNAPPGEPRYGRTSTLKCQQCRCALPCTDLHCLASYCLRGIQLGLWLVAMLLPSKFPVLLCPKRNCEQCAVLCCSCTCIAEMAVLPLAASIVSINEQAFVAW